MWELREEGSLFDLDYSASPKKIESNIGRSNFLLLVAFLFSRI